MGLNYVELVLAFAFHGEIVYFNVDQLYACFMTLYHEAVTQWLSSVPFKTYLVVTHVQVEF